jgi:hypothetical protein
MEELILLKNLLLLIMIILVAGCSNEQQIIKETVTPNSQETPKPVITPLETIKPSPEASMDVQTTTPKPSATPTSSPTPTQTVTPTPQILKENKIITGKFMYAWSTPRYSGIAEVTKAGVNKYHLKVSVVVGFSHHNGEIDSDFTVDGKNIVFSNNDYKNVTLTFTENSLTIDYPGEGFGGANAAPKGTFYLSNSGVEDAAFLTKLYDKIKLSDVYRHGFTDVLTYKLNETQQILLIQSHSSVDRTRIIEKNLALYDSSNQNIDHLGKMNTYFATKLGKKLVDLQIDPELINVLLHKDYADRFIKIQMQRFDNGDQTVLKPDQFKLTDAEAFYIATGIENATSISQNTRNSGDIGSIYSAEVDHSNDKTVTIHIYNLVGKNEQEIHTVTYDWLEVIRSTGIVKSLFD